MVFSYSTYETITSYDHSIQYYFHYVTVCVTWRKWRSSLTLTPSPPNFVICHGPVLLKELRLRPKFSYLHYFLIQADLKIILIFYKELGISNRIASFANFCNQLKILAAVVSPFVKWASEVSIEGHAFD
jgi:hypothetical protein